MFKKLMFSIVIVISFMVTLVGMEPDICPKFNTADDLNSFLFQLKKTGRTKDHTFRYQGNTWIISDKEFLMIKESIFHKNEESISKETTEDYFIVDEIQFVKNIPFGLDNSTKDALCYYNALGTGRKNGKVTTISIQFKMSKLCTKI
ncbi:MAG: hypothetical protein ACOH2E_01695 [Candidatus Paracaedibacter sp.]